MEELNFKGNSHKQRERERREKEQKPEVSKVVSGNVKTKKKSEIAKFADVFVSEDLNNVKSYIFLDVLIPAAKKAISDIVTNGIDMILYGESRHTKRDSISSRVSYRSYYDKGRDRDRDRDRDRSLSRRKAFDYDDIIFDTYADADEVLSTMEDYIETYGDVSVDALFALAGVTDDNYMNAKYGWTNLSSAKIRRVRDGYVLDLPKTMPI